MSTSGSGHTCVMSRFHRSDRIIRTCGNHVWCINWNVLRIIHKERFTWVQQHHRWQQILSSAFASKECRKHQSIYHHICNWTAEIESLHHFHCKIKLAHQILPFPLLNTNRTKCFYLLLQCPFAKVVSIKLNVRNGCYSYFARHTSGKYAPKVSNCHWHTHAHTCECCSFVELWVVRNHYYYGWHFQFDWIYLRRSIQRALASCSVHMPFDKKSSDLSTCVWFVNETSRFLFLFFKVFFIPILICVKLNTIGSLSFLLFRSSHIAGTAMSCKQTNNTRIIVWRKVKTEMFIQFIYFF